MLAKAVERYIRISPRKARYVMAPLRKRTVAEALHILSSTNKKACKPVAKAIASAFANAKQKDPTLVEEQVLISSITADAGPVWKRFRAAAFGRAVRIRKPTSHITVGLERSVSKIVPAAIPTSSKAEVKTNKKRFFAKKGKS
jgi:large subunit ribosomal protein L22